MKPSVLIWLTLINTAMLAASCMSVPEEERRSKLKWEEFLQRLEAANPWNKTDIEKAFVAKFDAIEDSWHIIENLAYAEGLIIKKMSYQAGSETKPASVFLKIAGETGCFINPDKIMESYSCFIRDTPVHCSGSPLEMFTTQRIEHRGYTETVETVVSSADEVCLIFMPIICNIKHPWSKVDFIFWGTLHSICLRDVTFISEKKE